MKIGVLGRLALVAGCFAITGCANVNQSKNMAGTINTFQNGDTVTALSQMGDNPPEKTDLLFNFEYGEIARMQSGPIDKSTDAFMKADREVQKWEDETRANLAKPAGAFASYVLSDGFRTYEGHDYEKSLLSNRLAVNRVLDGDWDNARVEIKKLTDRETLIKNYNDAAYQAVEDKAKTEGVKATPAVETINGYPVETISSPEVLGLKNAYQSAASHYLAGYVFEALGEPSLAAPGYRQAIELQPNSMFLKQSLANLDDNVSGGYTPAASLPRKKGRKGKGSTPAPLAANETDVLFVVETGALSPIESKSVTIPVPLPSGIVLATSAYPVVTPSQDIFDPRTIDVGGRQVPLDLVTDIDVMARRTVRDELPAMMARNFTRLAISTAAQAAALQARDNNGNQSAAGMLVALMIGVASAATADVDTRHWTTLPAQIYMGRMRLPQGGMKLAVNTPGGPREYDVDITGKYQVVYVRTLRHSAVVHATGQKEAIKPDVQPEIQPAVAIVAEPAADAIIAQ